jgi:hypothetical protein
MSPPAAIGRMLPVRRAAIGHEKPFVTGTNPKSGRSQSEKNIELLLGCLEEYFRLARGRYDKLTKGSAYSYAGLLAKAFTKYFYSA